jgi:hypothetical protein
MVTSDWVRILQAFPLVNPEGAQEPSLGVTPLSALPHHLPSTLSTCVPPDGPPGPNLHDFLLWGDPGTAAGRRARRQVRRTHPYAFRNTGRSTQRLRQLLDCDPARRLRPPAGIARRPPRHVPPRQLATRDLVALAYALPRHTVPLEHARMVLTGQPGSGGPRPLLPRLRACPPTPEQRADWALLDQGDPAQFHGPARSGSIGASSLSKVVGVNSIVGLAAVWAVDHGDLVDDGIRPERGLPLDTGHWREDMVQRVYELLCGAVVARAGVFVHPGITFLHATPDGLSWFPDEESRLLPALAGCPRFGGAEFKTRMHGLHWGRSPAAPWFPQNEHVVQVQMQAGVLGLPWVDYTQEGPGRWAKAATPAGSPLAWSLEVCRRVAPSLRGVTPPHPPSAQPPRVLRHVVVTRVWAHQDFYRDLCRAGVRYRSSLQRGTPPTAGVPACASLWSHKIPVLCLRELLVVGHDEDDLAVAQVPTGWSFLLTAYQHRLDGVLSRPRRYRPSRDKWPQRPSVQTWTSPKGQRPRVDPGDHPYRRVTVMVLSDGSLQPSSHSLAGSPV